MRRDADAVVEGRATLAELRLQNLRCLVAGELALHPRVNLITGPIGAGKTSLLEGIYLLARGRSFRTRFTEQLIRHGQEALSIAGAVHAEQSVRRPSVRCERHGHIEARIDGEPVGSLAELAELFPIQVIDPGIHGLLDGGPLPRRRWLDWAMFHVEPTFLAQWQDYRRALRQRNAALKAGARATLWDGELQRLGDPLAVARGRLIEELQPFWSQTLQALDAVPATLGFFRGWRRDQDLIASLATQLEHDRLRGSTSLGPHRFDVLVRLQGRAVRDIVSRGQQKLLGAAMALSLARFMAHRTGLAPTLLIDDPAAELDEPHTRALLAASVALGGQQVLTALRAEQLPMSVDRAFHVEREQVKRL